MRGRAKNGHGPIGSMGRADLICIQAHARIKQRRDECPPSEALRDTEHKKELERIHCGPMECARALSLARRWSHVSRDLLRPEEI